MKKPSKFYIDYEAADLITKENLKEAVIHLKADSKQIRKRIKGGEKVGQHTLSDLEYNERLLIHIVEVLKYYGG